MIQRNCTMLVVILLAFLCPANTSAQSKAVARIKQLLENQQVAWNNGDIEGFMQGYWKSDSLVFVGKLGFTWGWKSILNNYQKNYNSPEKRGILNFEIIQLKILSRKSASAIGKWSIVRENNPVQGHFLLVFQKIEHTWKIVADHTN